MVVRGWHLAAAFAALTAVGGAAWWQLRAENRGLAKRLRREEAMRVARDGRHAEAALALGEVLRHAPGDLEVAYLQAREADAAGDYNAAREGYLRVLALDPRLADARARLVELTERAGARDEARHHLARLEQILGGSDPRVRALRGRLGTADGGR